jgi:hypothetical protein
MTTIGNHRVELRGARVLVYMDFCGRWAHTDLQRSWYGYVLGFTDDFADEESAHYAAVETVALLEALRVEPSLEPIKSTPSGGWPAL